MATKLVQGGRIKDGVFETYDKASKGYVSTGQKVNAADFGKTEVGKATQYSGSNQVVANYSNNYKPKGIISSNSVLSEKNKVDARLQAGSALTSSPSDYNQGGGLESQYMNLINSNQQAVLNEFGEQRQMVKLQADSALRRSNQQYNNLLSDLETSLQNDTSMAEQQAAALNPYSQAQGAMTARNFQGAIQDKYQTQALKIQQAATAAEEALRNNEQEAYMKITQGMKESNRTFQQGMMEYMLGAQSEMNKNQQWEKSFGLQQKTFDLNSSVAYQGQYNDFVENFAGDPAFQQEIDNYFATGELTDSLKPLVEKGRMNGMSIDQALGVAQYKTQTQRKMEMEQAQFDQQMSLGWYNANTSRISATKPAAETTTTSNIPPEMKQSILQMLSSKGITKQRREDIIDLVETGGTEAAFTWVYNNMFSAEQKKDFDSYQSAVPVITNALQTIQNDQVSFGPYKTLFESAKPWIGMERDPKYAEVRSEIENAQSEIRRALYGTAVTAAEKGTAENFLIKDSDSAEIIKIKLQGLTAIAQYTNDVKRATPLGLEKSISLQDYLPASTPDALKQNQASANVQFGIPGQNTNVNDYLNSLGI